MWVIPGLLQVKAKYDTVAQMWDSLPTNAELLQRQGLTEEEEMVSAWMGHSVGSVFDITCSAFFSTMGSSLIVLTTVLTSRM